MKTLLVEPHPDDLLLSMHGILCSEVRDEWDGIYVLTTSSDNGRDSKKYCDNIGANLVDSKPLPDIFFGKHKLNANDVKASEHPWQMQRLAYGNRFIEELEQMMILIEGVVDNYGIDMIIAPIGIYHPLHVIVSTAVTSINTPVVKLFYADTPYQFRVYGIKIIEDFKAQGFDLYYEFSPDEANVKEKLKLFKQCYPTESVHWDESKFIDFTEKLFWKENWDNGE